MSLTVREQLLAQAGNDTPGLLFEDDSWTWAEVVRESTVRSAVLADLLPAELPPHVGVLLDNTPEFSFLLGAAALGGHVLVGLNPTRRGPALAADIERSDTQVVRHRCDVRRPARRTRPAGAGWIRLDEPGCGELLATHADASVPTGTSSRTRC